MDIKVEMEDEQPKFRVSSVIIKIEDANEDISKLDIKTERDLSIKLNQNSNLSSTSVKKEPDNDDSMFVSDVDIKRLKDEFSLSEVDDEVLSQIKTEELMLKSEIEDDDSRTGADWGRNVDVHTMFKMHHCLHCDYKTTRKSDLYKHILVEHHNTTNDKLDGNLKPQSRLKKDNSSKKKYHCDHCHYNTYKKSSLKIHVLSRHDNNTIDKLSCDHCEYKTHHRGNFKRHMKTKHDISPIKKYSSDHCDYQTNWKSCFINHMFKHAQNPIKKYSCNYCDYKTKMENYLKNHIISKHVDSPIKKYSRDHYNYKLNPKICSLNQISKQDESPIKYNCNRCNYNTNKKSYLKKHILSKHDETTKRHHCLHCDYTTIRKSDLNRHILLKHDKNAIKKYNCDHCDYKSHLRENLIVHVMSKHDNSLIKNTPELRLKC